MRAPFTPFTAASVPLAVFIAVVLGAPSAVVAQCTNPAPPDCILFGRDTSLLNPFERFLSLPLCAIVNIPCIGNAALNFRSASDRVFKCLVGEPIPAGDCEPGPGCLPEGPVWQPGEPPSDVDSRVTEFLRVVACASQIGMLLTAQGAQSQQLRAGQDLINVMKRLNDAGRASATILLQSNREAPTNGSTQSPGDTNYVCTSGEGQTGSCCSVPVAQVKCYCNVPATESPRCDAALMEQVNVDVRLAIAIWATVRQVLTTIVDNIPAGRLFGLGLDSFVGIFTPVGQNMIAFWDLLDARLESYFQIVLEWLRYEYSRRCGIDFVKW